MVPEDLNLRYIENSLVASFSTRPEYIPRYRDQIDLSQLSAFGGDALPALYKCYDERRDQIQKDRSEINMAYMYVPPHHRKRFLDAQSSDSVTLNPEVLILKLRELERKTLVKNLLTRLEKGEITAEEALARVAEFAGGCEAKTVDTRLLLDEIIGDMERDKHEDWDLTTGIPSLDRMTRGLQRGTLTVVGGLTSSGKTALGLTMGIHLVKQNRKVLYLTAEMSHKAILRRVLHMEGGKSDAEMRGEIAQRIVAYPLVIREVFDSGLIPNIVSNTEPDVVVVDHLQQLETKNEETRALSLASVARRLKRLSLERNIAVIALSQLSREVARAKRAPILADLRESGGIEENADVVVFVHPSKLEDGRCLESDYELIVGKNRNGRCGTILLYFDFKRVFFGEKAEAYRSA